MSDNNNSQWHLSKSVPITFILAIVMQTVSLVWYVSSLDNSVSNNAREILRQEVRIENLEEAVQTQAVTLGRIDENINSIREMMQEIARRQ